MDVDDVEPFGGQHSLHLTRRFDAHRDAGNRTTGGERNAAAKGDDLEVADIGRGLWSGPGCEQHDFVASARKLFAEARHVGDYAAMVGEVVWGDLSDSHWWVSYRER